MINAEKLKEYENYHGSYDMFFIYKVKSNSNSTTDDEWYLIGNLMTDIKIVKNGFASKEFKENLDNKLMANCDNSETIEQLKKLADTNWL